MNKFTKVNLSGLGFTSNELRAIACLMDTPIVEEEKE
jgi:hypothetical protein